MEAKRDAISLSEWTDLLLRLRDHRVLVVGDVILDAYVHGAVNRISPEAPVPVVEVTEEEHRLGGAANVAANVAALGTTCDLVGTVCEDMASVELEKLLVEAGVNADGLVHDASRPTSFKTRVIAKNQQIVRIDRESRNPVSGAVRHAVLERIALLMESAEVVILEDYNKGLLDAELIAEVRARATERGLPIVVDPKIENFWSYKGVTCVTPNAQEAGDAAGRRIDSDEDLLWVGRRLLNRLGLEHLLITRGPEGMTLFQRWNGDLRVAHIPTVAREVFDVTGAGDTVVAVFATALAAGASPLTAARLANYAARIVVAHLGCATASYVDLRAVIAERALHDASQIRFETVPLVEADDPPAG